jgi:hypothetical protein
MMHPMPLGTLLLLCAALLWPGAAGAQSPTAVLEAFGYFGRWAPDCSRSPVPGNPHMTVSKSPRGTIEVRNSLGPDYLDNVNILLDARSLGPDRVWIKTQLNNSELREWEVVRQAGRIRTFVNRKPDGTHITRDGLVVASGNPTPWLNRCGGASSS